ncbi:MAG TPA: hypothetical protein VFE78_10435 [Gemmataceae bacterium]|jgi:hypothetical protein|nr:hypothetical protein [Gemmataceae bacterium]
MKSLSCAALALSLLLARASAGFAQEKMETTPYYPLAVGATWEYKVGESKFTMKVTKHEKVGNVLCARLEMLKDNKPQSFEHVSVTKDGVCRNTFEDKEAMPPVLFFKLPPKKDQSWNVDSKAGGASIKGTFKDAGEEDVKVPAGSYKAVVVASQDLEANGVKMSITYYFAKDVGMVKQVVEIAGQKVIVELEKYEAGKS